MDRGTTLAKIGQQNCPLQLVAMTHTTEDLLAAAKLKNVSCDSICAFRLGWVVIFRSGKTELHLGRPTSPSGRVDPGATWDAPAQSVAPNYADQRAAVIAFFVAEVYFPAAPPWKADVVEMKAHARAMIGAA